MKKLNYKISSNCDGLLLDVLECIPDSNIKGVFVISHGMAEHKERYEGLMCFLAQNGYVACINDHRGHGKSVKDKKDLGYFYDETGKYIVEDTLEVIRRLKKKYPEVPVCLFGHSMGSLVASAFVSRYDSQIDQLILCGLPSANPAAGIALGLVAFLTKLKGNHFRSNLINTMAFSSYNKNIHDEDKNEFSWLSVNRQNVQEYIEDEECGYVFTLNGFKNLFILMKDAYDQKNWKCTNKSLPILYIAGSEDPCIVDKKTWFKSQDFMRNVGYTNIVNHMYNGYRHEILLEEIKENVYKDILEFIEK